MPGRNPAPPAQTIYVPTWIDNRFPADQKKAIRSAIEDWNYALDGYEKFTIVSDSYDAEHDLIPDLRVAAELEGLIIHYETVGSPNEVDVDPEQAGVLAWVPDFGANDMYIVSDRIGDRNLHTIVMHEIGHILGAPHVDIAGSLMYPHYPLQRDCIDEVTAQIILDKHAKLRWDHMKGLCKL